MPDIGQLFPDNDPRLLRANSEIFMEEARTLALTLAHYPNPSPNPSLHSS